MTTKMKKWWLFAAVSLFCCIVITGCAGATGNVASGDPVERRCSYIAAAIVTSAIIRAFCNK